jgi:chromosome partitioning protein
MAKRLSIINFKGGVGKTALALHLGCFLAARRTKKSKVLFIDVDHQSSLSIVVLDPAPWEAAATAGTTINSVFSSFTVQGAALPGMEAIVSHPLGDSYPTLDIAPAQLELDDTEIELGSTTIGNPLVSEWRKRTLLCRWLLESGADDEYDFIIFDCPPATKIVSQNAIAASHAYVVPVIPDSVSARGVTHLIQLVANRIDARMKAYASALPAAEKPSTFVPNTKLAGVVISMAQTHGPAHSGYINEHSDQMSALRRLWPGYVLDKVIERATGVAESLGAGWPVYDRDDNVNVSSRNLPAMYDAVCNELIGRLGW